MAAFPMNAATPSSGKVDRRGPYANTFGVGVVDNGREGKKTQRRWDGGKKIGGVEGIE